MTRARESMGTNPEENRQKLAALQDVRNRLGDENVQCGLT